MLKPDNLPAAASEAFAGFRSVTSVPIRWGDMDACQHVNNVCYIRWFEYARLELLGSIEGDDMLPGGTVGGILASVKCDYKLQLRFPDTVHIGTRVERMGHSSLHLHHAVFSESLGDMAAFGASVLVMFNYETNQPVRVPDAFRDAMTNG